MNLTMAEISNNLSLEQSTPRIGELHRVTRIMFSRWVVVLGLVIILIFAIMAIFAPIISPYDPLEQDLNHTLETPSSSHLLGTDELGRDSFSRIIYGTRIAIMVGVVAISVSGAVGMALGLLAGYYGGWTQIIIMRMMDALMALPPIILMLAIAALMGGGLNNVLIAVGIGMLPTYCRLMYGQIITLKESDYVIAARVGGNSAPRIMLRHLLPNAFPPLLVLVTVNMGAAILVEASLSFLGIGISPPTPTWGTMVSTGYSHLLKNPWLSFSPGVAILLLVMAFNLVGDGLRDAFDPRLRGKI
jgi:peptide/nickel transport system permease protein